MAPETPSSWSRRMPDLCDPSGRFVWVERGGGREGGAAGVMREHEATGGKLYPSSDRKVQPTKAMFETSGSKRGERKGPGDPLRCLPTGGKMSCRMDGKNRDLAGGGGGGRVQSSLSRSAREVEWVRLSGKR